MRRSVRSITFFLFLMFAATLSLRAQVVPSAEGRQFTITAGALGSAYQPDYAGGGIPSTSPNRLYGPGAYVDLKFNRWVQIEAEGRWLRYNQYIDINQSTYLIGPRLAIPHARFWRATPYAKVLAGEGKMNFEFNEASGSFTAIAYGGGVDIKLSKRWSVRAFDFEYQQWPKWINNKELYPYGGSVGIGYRVF